MYNCRPKLLLMVACALFAGLQQVNIVLPSGLASGDYEVQVEVAGAMSQTGLRIAVEESLEEK